MQKKSLFKKALSGILAGAMFAGSLMGYQPLTASAVETTLNDATISGTGSVSSIKGNWCTLLENPCVYRLSVVRVANPDTLTSDTVIKQSQHYEFRDIALYEVGGANTEQALKAYAFTSATTRTANTIEHLTLGKDSTYGFDEVGIGLKLPTQIFSATNYTIHQIHDELASKIRTEDTEAGEANIRDIFAGYIEEVGRRYDSLSVNGKYRFNNLVSESGYGTPNWDSWSKNFGLCIEICSVGTNRDGQSFIFSYGDALYTGIGSDIYYVYKPLNESNNAGTLLTWSAKYNTLNYNVTGEYNGQAVFLLYNTKPSTEVRSQSLNISLSLDSKLRADINTSDVSKNFRVVTTEKKPNVSLGDNSYTTVKDNAYNNALADTEITLSDGSTVLKTADKSNSLKTLSGKGNYSSDSILLGYQTLNIPIKADTYDLNALSSADIESSLANVTASTKTTAIANGFGNKYSLNFKVNDETVRSSVANAVKLVNGVSNVDAGVTLKKAGTVTNMADLQSATLLSGKIEGKPSNNDLINTEGTIYASISYLAKDKRVRSKEAETYINASADVEGVKDIEKKNYSVTKSVKWGITGKSKSYTYAIAWRASDYNLTDEKALTREMLSSLGDTYILRGSAGVSTLKKAFKNVTGKDALGVKYMKDTKSITVGSTAKDNNSLTGINVLVVNVSKELPVNVKSEDLVDSNELNYIYPNLLGWKSTINKIVPIAAYASDISYPYTVSDSNAGNLISFKGDKVHYYYEPTGLFGVFSQGTKSFSTTSYPSYAYNISRALWGDSLVLSNYKGLSATDEDVQNDIKNNLGLSIGAVGNVSSVTCGENVDDTVSEKQEDKYKFTGSITLDDGSSFNERNNYTITHSLNKYTCVALDTALSSKAGKVAFSKQSNKLINNKIAMVTQSTNTLTVYPEVAYKYYLPETSNGVLNNVKSFTVYAMGERARTMKPSSIRGIAMEYSNGARDVAEGVITSDGAMTGSSSHSMSDGKQVLAQGTNITMKADHTVDYKLISYSLDVVDTYGGVNVRNEFSNKNIKYQPDKEHEDFVQEFIDNVQVDTYMTIGNKEYLMVTVNPTPKVSQSTDSMYFTIDFAEGKIDEDMKDAVIDNIAAEYDISKEEATKLFKNAGFEKQLQDMFESNNDSNNASKNKWYDEESVTLCIRKYVTVVNLGTDLVQDKIDWNTVGNLGRDSVGRVKDTTADSYFDISVSLPKDFAGCDLENANKLIERQKIKNTEFKVSSQTTNDFGD